MRVLAVLLVLPLLVAGCVRVPGADRATETAGVGAFVDPIVDDHDHAAFEEHAFSTPSMELVAHTTMTDDGKALSYIGEMDTWGDLSVVQVLGRGSMPGFVVLDVSDPAHPTPIGRAEMPFSYVVDVKFSPDGKSVFAASQAGPQRTRAYSGPAEDPVTAALTGNGFTQWDLADPANPVAVAGGLVEPTGCHMLSVKELGGEMTVFCVANVVMVFRYAGQGAWTQIATLGAGASGTGLERVVGETVAAGTGAPGTLLLSAEPHDITVQEDPAEPGRWLAAVSYWDFGLRFFDVTDPAGPVELGAWAGEGAEVYEGNVHGAILALHGGKRVAVVGPELLGSTFPALWVLDLDDLSAPTAMAEWVPPGQHATQGLLLTTHQFQIVDGRIYLAYNHAGVWVLDLARIVAGGYAEDPARPEVLGYYVPHEKVELFDPEHAAVPNTWDVNVKDGYVFAVDRYTGFYVLHYVPDARGDPALTSFA
jgi:hypothetical protein